MFGKLTFLGRYNTVVIMTTSRKRGGRKQIVPKFVFHSVEFRFEDNPAASAITNDDTATNNDEMVYLDQEVCSPNFHQIFTKFPLSPNFFHEFFIWQHLLWLNYVYLLISPTQIQLVFICLFSWRILTLIFLRASLKVRTSNAPVVPKGFLAMNLLKTLLDITYRLEMDVSFALLRKSFRRIDRSQSGESRRSSSALIPKNRPNRPSPLASAGQSRKFRSADYFRPQKSRERLPPLLLNRDLCQIHSV